MIYEKKENILGTKNRNKNKENEWSHKYHHVRLDVRINYKNLIRLRLSNTVLGSGPE